MSENVTNELLLEHLKRLHDEARNARLERKEIRGELRAIKAHVVALVQSDLNRDSQQGSVYERLDRIERRLDLVDAPAE